MRPEDNVTVDNILKASGKTFKGKYDSSMTIKEITSEEGKFTLKVGLESPGPTSAAASGIRVLPAKVPVKPAPIPQQKDQPAQPIKAQAAPLPIQASVPVQVWPALRPAIMGYIYWNLLDSKGQRMPQLPLIGSLIKGHVADGRWIQEFTVSYLIQKDQVPTKLTFASSHSVTLEIPFTLKDVPLK